VERIRGVSGPITGHYRFAVQSGPTTTLTAISPVFTARWATVIPGLCAAILRFKVSFQTIVAFTTAQEIQATAFLASGYTANRVSGNQVIPAAGQNSLLRSVEATQQTQFTDLRIANATALAGGTMTLDTQPFAWASSFSTNPSPGVLDFNVDSEAKMPLILQGGGPLALGNPTLNPSNAQGIDVGIGTVTQGAAGTVRYLVEMEWVEFNSFGAETLD
jgi:hypothetical protein